MTTLDNKCIVIRTRKGIHNIVLYSSLFLALVLGSGCDKKQVYDGPSGSGGSAEVKANDDGDVKFTWYASTLPIWRSFFRGDIEYHVSFYDSETVINRKPLTQSQANEQITLTKYEPAWTLRTYSEDNEVDKRVINRAKKEFLYKWNKWVNRGRKADNRHNRHKKPYYPKKLVP